MATFLSDRFDEASATALTSHTPNIGGAYSLTTGGGSISVGAGTGSVVFDSAGTWYVADNAATPGSNVQTVTFDAQSGGAGNGVLQIWLRKTAGALTGYRLMAHSSVGMQIHQMTGGVETALVASNGATYATNATLDGTASIDAAGLLTLDIAGLGTISGTNTAITAAGVIAFGSRDLQFNDLVATDDTSPTADLTGSITEADDAPTGSMAPAATSSLTGSITEDEDLPTGNLGAVAGTINIGPWKSDVGMPLPSTTIPKITFLRDSDGVQVLTLLNQVTSSSPTAPMIPVTNGALTPGQKYWVASWKADGSSYGLEPFTAA